MTGSTYWRDHEVRGHDCEHVARECLGREGPKDESIKVHYIDAQYNFPLYPCFCTNIANSLHLGNAPC